MLPTPFNSQAHRQAIGASFRLLRTYRRMRQADLAKAMGLSPRAYQEIEAGHSRIYLDQVMTFAEATSSDPFGLASAIMLEAPQLGEVTAENKLMTILQFSAHDFLQAIGPEAEEIRTREFIREFEVFFSSLTHEAEQRRSERNWLQRLIGSRRGLWR